MLPSSSTSTSATTIFLKRVPPFATRLPPSFLIRWSTRLIPFASFSTSLGKPGTLGSRTKYWRGYYQSLRPTQMGLSLNIGWLFYFSKYMLISVNICLMVNTSLSALNNVVFVNWIILVLQMCQQGCFTRQFLTYHNFQFSPKTCHMNLLTWTKTHLINIWLTVEIGF